MKKPSVWIASLFCAAFAVLVTIPAEGMPSPEVDRLTRLAQVWGLAKYRHPGVTSCTVDWDQAALDHIPLAESAASEEQFDTIVNDLLDVAGTGSTSDQESDMTWIEQQPWTANTRNRLRGLAQTRPSEQCYVDSDWM